MKREVIFVGRAGTVFVAIGLALLLVSLIPPARANSFSHSQLVPPNAFEPMGVGAIPISSLGSGTSNRTFYMEFIPTLTPQQELKIDLTFNDTMNVYLLKMNTQSVLWQFSENMGNLTLLEDFLRKNPDVVAWQGAIREGTVDYIPTELVNATLVFANPTSNSISVQYDGSVLNLLAPTSKSRTLALWVIPIGLVLSLPWLVRLWKNRKSRTRA